MKNLQVKKIDNSVALKLVIENHYLHRTCICIESYGLFDGGDVVGVCIFSPSAPQASSAMFKSKEKLYELSRVWVKDGYKTNTTSFFVSKSLKLFNKKLVVSYADPAVGHIGVIYQATNFIYLGLTEPNKDLKINGIDKSSYFKESVKELKEIHGDNNVYYEAREQKHRYLYINGSGKQKHKVIQDLKYPICDFPRKNENNIIYGLYDPECKGGKIRYVGKSTKGLARPKEHAGTYSLTFKTHKNNWIKSLLREGLMYEIKILKTFRDYSNKTERDEVLNAAEKYYVSLHRSKHLTNSTDGGEGTSGYVHRDETKSKIGSKRQEWIKNNPDRVVELGIKGRKPHQIIEGVSYKECPTCEHYLKLSEYNKDKNVWDGYCSECRKCNKKRTRVRPEKISPEAWKESYQKRRAAMTEGVKKAYENNPELKKIISQKKSKAIVRIALSTNEPDKEYPSALAAREDGFQHVNIGQAIKYNKPYRGYLWKFKA
jgi:hypothetical protein